MVGSEGTLGFVSQITLRTRAGAARARDGARLLRRARGGRARRRAARPGGRRRARDPRRRVAALDRRGASALLRGRRRGTRRCSSSCAAPTRRRSPRRSTTSATILKRHRLIEPERFTTGEAERAALWHLRKGLAARTGAMRPSGTAFLTEDVAVPVARLAEAIRDCQALFARHGVPDTAIFGHAKDGNLHFVLAEDVRSPEAVERYGAFMHGLVELVVGKYDGAIKAEHGSGRNMAPVRQARVGRAGLRRDGARQAPARPRRHPEPGRAAEREPALPPREPEAVPDASRRSRTAASSAATASRAAPRATSRSRRASGSWSRARSRGSSASAAPADRECAESLREDFAYEGVASCAGDSMCQSACPVTIDTGALMKELRAAGHGGASARIATAAAEHFGLVAALARAGLGAAALVRALPLGGRIVEAVAEAGNALAARAGAAPAALARPAACGAPSRVRGAPAPAGGVGRRRRAAAGSSTSRAASPGSWARCRARTARLPPGPCARSCAGRASRCACPRAPRACAAAWRSRARATPTPRTRRRARTAEALWRATSGGRLPVVTDASPCAGTLAETVPGDPARDQARDPDVRLPGVLGARGAAPAGGAAAAPGNRDPPPDVHAREGGRARRPRWRWRAPTPRA